MSVGVGFGFVGADEFEADAFDGEAGAGFDFFDHFLGERLQEFAAEFFGEIDDSSCVVIAEVGVAPAVGVVAGRAVAAEAGVFAGESEGAEGFEGVVDGRHADVEVGVVGEDEAVDFLSGGVLGAGGEG